MMLLLMVLLMRVQPDMSINEQSAASIEYAENLHAETYNNMYFRTAEP